MEIWLQDGDTVFMRVRSFGPTVELSPDQARQRGLACQELADEAGEVSRSGTRQQIPVLHTLQDSC